MANHYVNRVFRFYMIHMPWTLSTVANMATRILTERQKQKMQVIKDAAELRSEFALHQLELDLGGSRAMDTTFFPFPLCPGPFQAGCDAGPRSNAVPDLHRSFTAASLL